MLRDVSKKFCNDNPKNEHFLKLRNLETLSKKSNCLAEWPVCLFVKNHPIEARSEALRKPPNVPTLTQRFTLGHAGQRPNDDDTDGDDSYWPTGHGPSKEALCFQIEPTVPLRALRRRHHCFRHHRRHRRHHWRHRRHCNHCNIPTKWSLNCRMKQIPKFHIIWIFWVPLIMN